MTHVVYIAGYGRSGSTILDALLGNHPSMFGAGELTNLWEDWFRQTGVCSCGKQAHTECEFWRRVFDRIAILMPELTPSAAAYVTQRVEAVSGLPFLPDRTWESERQLYGQLWRTLFDLVSDISKKPVVVDSSKSTRTSIQRMRQLRRVGQLDVRVIHLVRDPRAVLFSRRRGNNRFLEAGMARKPLGVFRTLLSWMIANLAVHLVGAMDRGLPLKRVRYEDLMVEPTATLRDLGSFLNLDLEPVIILIEQQQPLEAGHGIAGNRTRRSQTLKLKLDDEWKQALPRHVRIAAVLSWPLARMYGYKTLWH